MAPTFTASSTANNLSMRGVLHASNEPPLIKAGLGHLWFLTLHPFDDGNGRIARAIGDLLLARGIVRKTEAGGRSTCHELNDLECDHPV